MRIIALTNQKGGVGKTTTTVNLAGNLAARGKKVLLIDLDPQAHLTTFLGVDPVGVTHSSYTVLVQSEPVTQAALPVRDNLKLLAAELNLAAAEQELVAVVGRETRLREALETYEKDQPCDYVLIDCPPSLGLLTLNALGASREVFIPIQPHFLSLQGLSQLLETLLLVQKRINPELKVSGLLFCMFDSRTTLTTEIVRDIEEFFTKQRGHDSPWRKIRIFDTRIRRNVKLAESPSHGQTIFEYEPGCHGALDYNALADEVESMIASTSDKMDVTPEPQEPTEAIPAPESVPQAALVSKPKEKKMVLQHRQTDQHSSIEEITEPTHTGDIQSERAQTETVNE